MSSLASSPPLTDRELVLLAKVRDVLGEARTIDYAPDLRATAERRARHLHRAWLPADEPVLALHDQTLLRSGEEGFLVTAERLAFRGFFEAPWSVCWAEVDLSSVRLDAHHLVIGASGGHLEDRLVLGRLLELVRVLASGPGSPYR